nr:Hpt domain-containing protein [Roseateles albus]
MLRSFTKDLAAMPAILLGHLNAGERVDAERLMHTLKGLAATLGAGPLSALAAEAERLMAGDTTAETLLL